MHQPYYGDDIAKKTKMPWVFLHAIKDYYDMPYIVSRYDGIKATFNLVPSLLVQIKKYSNGTANDELLETLKEDVELLTSKDIEKLEEYLFLSNEANLIQPLWRYNELYVKYLKAQKSLKEFSCEEIIDAEVLFLLSWCGNYLKTNNNLIKSLLYQGANFSHKQKNDLINELILFCGKIIEFYKELALEGKIELSTTPFYHPIAPLLLDINSAKEANPYTTLPNIDCDFIDCITSQVEDAISYFYDAFGFYPKGFWPAEGSVSLKALELFSQNKISWIGTDEEILYKSIDNTDKSILYENYKDIQNNITLFFRDKVLSDLIGFEYSKQNPKDAVKDFILRLKKISLEKASNSIVSVILDGENAWEFYTNNGLEFFETLYSELQNNANFIQTILPSEFESLNFPVNDIKHIASGSWIDGNFDIWIGKKQKNKAWELLCQTKKDYITYSLSFPSSQQSAIKNEFMIALGSDWFWWYDDDHFTLQKRSFDNLFRLHLANIYTLMGKDIPQNIIQPIVFENEFSSSNNSAMHKTTSQNDDNSQFRYCKLTKKWVLFSPNRAKRPNNFLNKSDNNIEGNLCPFDVGNEYLTPTEIERIGDSSSWKTRVVPNLYNVLSIDTESIGRKDDYFDVFNGFGAHEVIIETPNHKKTMFDYDLNEFVDYLTICQNRIKSLQNDTRLKYVSLFKNSGSLAGASQSHDHSQLIAIPFVPSDIEDEINYKKEYYHQFKRGLLDDLVYEEKKYEKNFIFENESFVCYAPYASKFPYEVKIVAKEKIATIMEFNDTTMVHLGQSLKLIFTKYKESLGEFSFNMIFKNHPYENYSKDSQEYFRFCINIYPRLNGIAGFELDSGIFLNSVLPSDVANKLRNL
jgi:galactose-1-phosphate uridylyltransferase (family 1)